MTRECVAPPEAGEYAPFYAGYVALARGHDPIALLERHAPTLHTACAALTEDAALFRYAPDKWSIKQVLGHLSDTERVMAYRLFRISRGDQTPLSGFEQNDFVEAANSNARTVASLLAEFESARMATLRMLDGIAPSAWTRKGVANALPVSARALLYIIAGHMEHHLDILRERYGLAIPPVGVRAD